ncbi:MAG TPA: peptidase dimerization domain-containing protein [Pseudonocardia sp.]|uniref:M20 family metallopeptidase n=1 Tax=Pseudonocardia sp. TaxID=60912 RepID=UPI002ED793EB
MTARISGAHPRTPALERVTSRIRRDRLADLVAGVVDVPSPTGDEAPLAEHIAEVLRRAGVPARTQPLDDRQANAWGRLHGAGSGPDLLLYAPLDTVTSGREEEDLSWAADTLRPDMRPVAKIENELVCGLGASNPKGHVACVIAAAEVVAGAVSDGDLALTGDLLVGFGAGGMPTNARPGVDNPRRNTGQGVGCSFLLEQGVWPDYAVIAKPGWSVSWEEVGLTWFDVAVHGTHTYVGSRHRLPYRNAVDLAGQLVHGLEQWFPRYAEAHTDGLVAPQGVVASIRGGTERTASFTPAECVFTVDLRLSPRSTPAQARREFTAALAEIADRIGGVDYQVQQVLAIPGERTDPDSWVCRAAIAAWEEMEGRRHEPVTGMSGATDANILRNRGVPTVRLGMPKVTEQRAGTEVDFALGMNLVDLREAARLTEALVRIAVDTLTRTRVEVGLDAG